MEIKCLLWLGRRPRHSPPPPPPSDSGKSFGHTCREQHRMGGRGPGLGMKEPRVSPRHQWRDSELEGAREEPV